MKYQKIQGGLLEKTYPLKKETDAMGETWTLLIGKWETEKEKAIWKMRAKNEARFKKKLITREMTSQNNEQKGNKENFRCHGKTRRTT